MKDITGQINGTQSSTAKNAIIAFAEIYLVIRRHMEPIGVRIVIIDKETKENERIIQDGRGMAVHWSAPAVGDTLILSEAKKDKGFESKSSIPYTVIKRAFLYETYKDTDMLVQKQLVLYVDRI